MSNSYIRYSVIDAEVRKKILRQLEGLPITTMPPDYRHGTLTVVSEIMGSSAYICDTIEKSSGNTFEGEYNLIEAKYENELYSLHLSRFLHDALELHAIIIRNGQASYQLCYVGSMRATGFRYTHQYDSLSNDMFAWLSEEIQRLEPIEEHSLATPFACQHGDGSVTLVSWDRLLLLMPSERSIAVGKTEVLDWLSSWLTRYWNATQYERELIHKKYPTSTSRQDIVIYSDLKRVFYDGRVIVRIAMTLTAEDKCRDEWNVAYCNVITDSHGVFHVFASGEEVFDSATQSIRMGISDDGVMLEDFLDAYQAGNDTVTTLNGEQFPIPDLTLRIEPFDDDAL